MCGIPIGVDRRGCRRCIVLVGSTIKRVGKCIISGNIHISMAAVLTLLFPRSGGALVARAGLSPSAGGSEGRLQQRVRRVQLRENVHQACI